MTAAVQTRPRTAALTRASHQEAAREAAAATKSTTSDAAAAASKRKHVSIPDNPVTDIQIIPREGRGMPVIRQSHTVQRPSPTHRNNKYKRISVLCMTDYESRRNTEYYKISSSVFSSQRKGRALIEDFFIRLKQIAV